MTYYPTRSKKLIAWARPWVHFKAKTADPQEPSIGRLTEELGEQLEAAGEMIDRLLALLPAEQRLHELKRMNAIEARHRAGGVIR